MISMEQRQKIASFVFTLFGGVIAVFMWMIGGSDAIIYVVLGLLIAASGLAMWRGRNKLTSYALLTAGVVALVIAVSRALWYGPTNDLAIVLFVLGIVLLFRGYQWFRVVRKSRPTSKNA